MRSIWLLGFSLFGAVACGGEAAAPTGGGGGAGGGPGPEPLEQGQATIGPVPAAPDADDTVCITRRMDNVEAGYVRRVSGGLSEGSHHMIVYTSEETEEQLTPRPCQGLGGLISFDAGGIPGVDSPNIPIFIVQQRETELVMPRDGDKPVGFRIQPQQMLLIELHYYNTGTAPRDVTGSLSVEYIPDSSGIAVTESSFGFWGTVGIDLDPYAPASTAPLFQKGLVDTTVFAVTTHQHSLGTRMRIWHSNGEPGDPGTLLADGQDWAEPPLEMLEPSVTFQPGEGLRYQCEWNNTTGRRVGFGEGFDDEMCFLWAYYYPSVGFDICVHMDSQTASSGLCNHLFR